MITYQFNDHNSPLLVVNGLALIEVNVPERPRIQYIGAFYSTGAVIAVQVLIQGKVFTEVLVNPHDERGRDILYRLSKQEQVHIGFFPLIQPVLVRRELALLLERAKAHVVTRPRWDEAVASYKEGE